jgi:hypothetical protein
MSVLILRAGLGRRCTNSASESFQHQRRETRPSGNGVIGAKMGTPETVFIDLDSDDESPGEPSFLLLYSGTLKCLGRL